MLTLCKFALVVFFVLGTALTLASAGQFIARFPEKARATDFATFYSAGRLVDDGNLEGVYRADSMLRQQRSVDSMRTEPEPFPYPPAVAALLAPLALLPFTVSWVLFLCINGIALLLAGCSLWKLASPSQPDAKIALLITASLSYPLFAVLFHGKFDLLLTAALLVAVHQELNQHPVRSLVSAIPLVLKPQFLPGLVLFWVFRRRWLSLAAACCALVAVTIWPLAAQPATLTALAELYGRFFSGHYGGWANVFNVTPIHMTPTGIASIAAGALIAAVVVGVSWYSWNKRVGSRRDAALIFLLPLVVGPYGPNAVILAGTWALFISCGVLDASGAAFTGMAMALLFLAEEIIPVWPLMYVVFFFVVIRGFRAAESGSEFDSSSRTGNALLTNAR
jgi:hypothetical protein